MKPTSFGYKNKLSPNNHNKRQNETNYFHDQLYVWVLSSCDTLIATFMEYLHPFPVVKEKGYVLSGRIAT